MSFLPSFFFFVEPKVASPYTALVIHSAYICMFVSSAATFPAAPHITSQSRLGRIPLPLPPPFLPRTGESGVVGGFVWLHLNIFTDQTAGTVLQSHPKATGIRLSARTVPQPKIGLVRRVDRIAKTS